MDRFDIWDGSDDEMIVITRKQVGSLVKSAYSCGKTGAFYPEGLICVGRYEDVKYGDGRCDVCAREYYRLRRLHDVTAGHLTKARAELALLRYENRFMRRELDRWRGVELFDRSIPAHYRGDGYVTCSRAMESASVQDEVVPRSAMGMWWWMCAFKYVWRMWSKADPIADAMKALSCLEHIKDSLEEDLDER